MAPASLMPVASRVLGGPGKSIGVKGPVTPLAEQESVHLCLG